MIQQRFSSKTGDIEAGAIRRLFTVALLKANDTGHLPRRSMLAGAWLASHQRGRPTR